MRRHNGSVLLSPTDLNTFLGCRHASALDYRASIGGEKLSIGTELGPQIGTQKGPSCEVC